MKTRAGDRLIEELVTMRDKSFRAVLENDDLTLIEVYIEKYFQDYMKKMLNSNTPENRAEVIRRTVYKAIPECTSFTPEERNRARQWLRDHNSKPIDWNE